MRAFLSSDTFFLVQLSLSLSPSGEIMCNILFASMPMRYCRLLNFIWEYARYENLGLPHIDKHSRKKNSTFFFSMILELFHFDALKECSREGCLFQLKFFVCCRCCAAKKYVRMLCFQKEREKLFAIQKKKKILFTNLWVWPRSLAFFYSVVDEKNVFLIENMKKKVV